MKQLLFEIYNEDALFDAIKRVEEYVKAKTVKSLVFHMYCGTEDIAEVLHISRELKKAFPTAELCGIASHAEIINGALTDPVVLLSAMFFEKTEVRVFYFNDVLDREEEFGEKARRIIDDVPKIKAAEVLVQGAPVDNIVLLDEISKCNPDVKIFGGYPLAHKIDGGHRFLVTDGGVFDNALIIVTYAGEDFHIDVGYTAGWESLGRTFTITKAKKNRLYKVDDFSGMELYEKYLDIKADEHFVENTMEFPLMIEDDGMKMLRHSSLADEDGALEMAGYVREGMKVTMSYGDPITIISEVDERAEELRQFEPEAILIYTCTMRKIFWNYFINNEMAPFQKIASSAGFCTGGELNRDQSTHKIMWHNITMLTIGMREGDKTGREIEPARVDTSRLHGQASLVKRLTTLIRATSSELRQSLKDLEETNEKLLYMATVDELTALCNRREIERRINAALDAAAAKGSEVALLMMDVDHFKNVNDTFGHETGDKILEGVAAVLNATVHEEKGEAVGRWGGEEFFMLLPDKTLEEAVDIAEEIRQTVELYPFPKVEKLTCSLGVTTALGSEERKKVYARVDNALYEAKETGRNKTVVAKREE